MPDNTKPSLGGMISQHSDLSRMYKQISKAYEGIGQYSSANYQSQVAVLHRQTTNILYDVRQMLQHFVTDQKEKDLEYAAFNLNKALELLRTEVEIV